MKRWIHGNDDALVVNIDKIISDIETNGIDAIVLVDDAETFRPHDSYIEAADQINYNAFTREQLLQLDEDERHSIKDIDALRKLKLEELTPSQQFLLHQANSAKFEDPIRVVKQVLPKLKECEDVYIPFSPKNKSFRDEIKQLGGKVTDEDVLEIVKQLHVKDYCNSTFSYSPDNWNSLLMIFEFKGEHTFPAKDKAKEPVTVTSLDVYIKIDIDSTTGKSLSAMSFHNPEYKLSHPYANYPVDKE